MLPSVCPVLIEIGLDRLPADFTAPSTAKPVDVSLALRERGWTPYRVWLDPNARAWIAAVLYRSHAA